MEKLVDLKGVIGEEIQDGKSLVQHQAWRILKSLTMEIEGVFMLFYFIDLAPFVCVLNIYIYHELLNNS